MLLDPGLPSFDTVMHHNRIFFFLLCRGVLYRLRLRRSRYPPLFFHRGERELYSLSNLGAKVKVRENVRVYVRVNFVSDGRQGATPELDSESRRVSTKDIFGVDRRLQSYAECIRIRRVWSSHNSVIVKLMSCICPHEFLCEF